MSKALYVGNLSSVATAEELRKLFGRYGEVKNARIATRPILYPGRTLGFGFVEMASGAEAAINGLNGANFQDRILTVQEAQPRVEKSCRERGELPTLFDAIASAPSVRYFRVFKSEPKDPRDWQLDPLEDDILSDMDSSGLHVMKALNVMPDGTVRECYMDIFLPERVSDYIFLLEKGSLLVGRHHEFPGEIIPAVALDCFGVYEQFYSRLQPQLGIDVLKRGLAIAKRKRYIAQDLGYILRDEGRSREAAEMLQTVVDEGPSSCYVYAELAFAYADIGDSANEQKYLAMFRRAEMGEAP